MMTLVGCAALVWILVPLAWDTQSSAVRVVGAAFLTVIGIGAAVPFVVGFIPEPKPSKYEAAIGKANALCGSLWGMKAVALQPKGVVFTFVDLGPRLITVTHHDAIIGPYHRNGEQIADVMNAFRGDAGQAHRLITKYHSNYVLTCPNSSTTTIFTSETPKGFYGQLEAGRVPNWLQPIDLAARIRRSRCGKWSASQARTCGKLCFKPSITNWAANAARITPRMRVITASTLSPISRMIGPAASSVTIMMSITAVIAASTTAT